MPKFEIVHPNQPEAEPVEKPVQFKLEFDMDNPGDVFLSARETGDWLTIAQFDHADGIISLWPISDYDAKNLPSLIFGEDGKWAQTL